MSPALAGLRRAALAVFLIAASCSTTAWRGRLYAPADYATIDTAQPFLKAHTAEGHVYVFENWGVKDGVLSGSALHYDERRQLVGGKTSSRLALGEVVLVETNRPETVTSTGLATIGVVTGVSLAISALCLANPKACFGSCPTFTVDGRDGIVAEGFSESIARPLEATDVDALPDDLGSTGAAGVSLWMKNEALETHLVRRVRLLAVPRGGGETVVRVGDAFHPARARVAPSSCRAGVDDCLDAVRARDERAYVVPTDPKDLGAKDVLELEFPPTAAGPRALVLRARNSLVHTYVFYQLLAWLGVRADDFIRRLELEEANARTFVDRVVGPLSTIDVEVLGPHGWEPAGTYREVGPIAFDEGGVRLPDGGGGPTRLRLSMAKGAWKLDRVQLAGLGEARAAVPVEVARASRRGATRDDVRAQLRGEGARLVTNPGEAYRLDFELPAGNHQLFLEATGHYYEWIREAWLPEHDEAAFLDALVRPGAALQKLAPGYKKVEAQMEAQFWKSRVEAR